MNDDVMIVEIKSMCMYTAVLYSLQQFVGSYLVTCIFVFRSEAEMPFLRDCAVARFSLKRNKVYYNLR
jgi:hypothetical protein